jgi:hypothetical protein
MKRFAAGALRLFWKLGLAVQRAAPAWIPWPPTIDRAFYWAWGTTKRLAPTPEEVEQDRIFDEILNR